MADVATLWDDMLGHVRLTNPDLSRGWFRDLEPGEVDHGVLQIRARNAAQSRYLQMHCRVAFVEAAQAATGASYPFNFSLMARKTRKKARSSSAGPTNRSN